VPAAILRRRLDFRRLSMMDFGSTLVRTAVAVALAAAAGLDASALVIGNMAGIIVALAMALWFVRIPLPRWRGREIRDLLPYGGPAALACVAWTGFRNGDYAVIGARLGTTQAGFYWRGYQLAVDYQRKISAMMAQMAFPVLARSASEDEMDALRRRMSQLLAVTLFPLLAGLVLLAPTVVPWLFGPTWRPAVLPAQILALGGASTLVIDAVGSALMAAGRSRMLLAYGVAHFFVYVGAVVVVSSHGIAAVAGAAAVVHTLFLVIAYAVLPRRGEGVLRFLWKDVAPAVVSCAGLAAVGGPVEWALTRAGAPAPVHLLVVGAAATLGYGLTLRAFYPDNWRDLMTALGKVVPTRRLRVAARRIPLLASR
jgi:PST family polysaccharide transporter